MTEDPIVNEVRKARDEFAQRFNYDLAAICEELRRQGNEPGRKTVSFPPKRIEPKHVNSLNTEH